MVNKITFISFRGSIAPIAPPGSVLAVRSRRDSAFIQPLISPVAQLRYINKWRNIFSPANPFRECKSLCRYLLSDITPIPKINLDKAAVLLQRPQVSLKENIFSAFCSRSEFAETTIQLSVRVLVPYHYLLRQISAH